MERMRNSMTDREILRRWEKYGIHTDNYVEIKEAALLASRSVRLSPLTVDMLMRDIGKLIAILKEED